MLRARWADTGWAMRIETALLLMGFVGAIGGASAQDAPNLAAPLAVPVNARCEVRATQMDIAQACWTYSCERQPDIGLGCGISALSQVTEIAASPDGHWLAVVSVGEGHPMLEIIALDEFTREHRYRAQVEFNPYPGTLTLAGWHQGSLEVFSDALLDRPRIAGEPANFDLSEQQQRYRIEPLSWRVLRAE